ncbi:hypothetical protein MPSEU_000051000 [Mayamaea pseudoterrestris]|nr:hypothetical protein MPSEU_000051000 [Mayamaea pseudoterrestris]
MSLNAASFPFSHVLISFPDEQSAQAARHGPLLELQQRYQTTTLLATCDPCNVRIGSGGGSLACLSNVYATTSNHGEVDSILILHAGGESSRSPTQMVLGKAWTSFCTKSESTLTPIHVWLNICQELFQDGLPRGSVVILAADTLLTLPPRISALEWSLMEEKANAPVVIGLAVPAPLATAVNHGVYVVDENGMDAAAGAVTVLPCQQVLQKPSLETLQQLSSRTNDAHANSNKDSPSAWIDTGVCIFLPQAAERLKDLAMELEYSESEWTRRRDELLLEAMTDAEQNINDHLTIQDYARHHVVSLDLYTHFLHALYVENGTNTLDDYTQQIITAMYENSNLQFMRRKTLASVYQTLSACHLQVACVPYGQFLHLGTTRELMDIYVHGSEAKDREIDSRNGNDHATHLLHDFGRKLQLVKRHHWFATQSQVHVSAVVSNSLLISHDEMSKVVVGPGSIVEYSHIESAAAVATEATAHDHPANARNICIGRNCLVSGLRKYGSGVARNGLTLPDGMILQQIALAATNGVPDAVESTKMEAQSYFYMVLGVNDAIKQRKTIYGRSFDEFLTWFSLTADDLWKHTTADSHSSQHLWTAKIHPVVTVESFADAFGWLPCFLSGETLSENDKQSLQLWKTLPRLSLSEIRDCSDASAEFSFRNNLPKVISMQLEMHFARIRKTFMTRLHTMVDLQFILDSYAADLDTDIMIQTLEMLDDIFDEALGEGSFDICGRVAMVTSAVQAAAASLGPDDTGMVDNRQSLVLSSTSDVLLISASLEEMRASYRHFTRAWNDCSRMQPQLALKEASAIMELISHAMTRRCIDGGQPLHAMRTVDPVYNRWVMTTAPARIDLGGGWTDTPPICYEFGSAVTGVAVLVDGIKPLSCRCRILTGASSIMLRTEHRDCQTGGLLSHIDVIASKMDDLKNFSVPTADCALLKCALVCLGLVSIDAINAGGASLQPYINAFCHSSENVGLEIVSTSLLPHGSGMGTSSILGGCVLACIGRAVGIDLTVGDGDDDCSSLISCVLQLEQLLTTGGGFQDQVNGLIGGCKYESCPKLEFPLKVIVERLPVNADLTKKLNNSLVLLFTGKTRLAKGILQNVLRRWASRTVEITSAVEALVNKAKGSRAALLQADLDALGMCLSEYWGLKKVMAGEDGHAEPKIAGEIIDALKRRGAIRGASLCGAGGGGFMVILKHDHFSVDELKSILAVELADTPDKHSLTWHTCQVCEEGLATKITDEEVSSSMDTFDMTWLQCDY